MSLTFGQLSELGQAKFYADYFEGRKTANGEVYSKYELTCAHKTYPFGTILEVTRLDNNKTVRVRVNDRGPFVKNCSDCIIDLSWQAADQLGITLDGTAKVSIKKVDFSSVNPIADNPNVKSLTAQDYSVLNNGTSPSAMRMTSSSAPAPRAYQSQSAKSIDFYQNAINQNRQQKQSMGYTSSPANYNSSTPNMYSSPSSPSTYNSSSTPDTYSSRSSSSYEMDDYGEDFSASSSAPLQAQGPVSYSSRSSRKSPAFNSSYSAPPSQEYMYDASRKSVGFESIPPQGNQFTSKNPYPSNPPYNNSSNGGAGFESNTNPSQVNQPNSFVTDDGIEIVRLTGDEKGYGIQIGSYKDIENARRTYMHLRDLGVKVIYVKEVYQKNVKVYKVIVGHYETKGIADERKQMMESKTDLRGFVVWLGGK